MLTVSALLYKFFSYGKIITPDPINFPELSDDVIILINTWIILLKK